MKYGRKIMSYNVLQNSLVSPFNYLLMAASFNNGDITVSNSV